MRTIFTKLLKIKLIEKEMTAKELAAMLGTTQQNLSAKMRRDNFSEKEMLQIAEVLGLSLKIELKRIDNWTQFWVQLFYKRFKATNDICRWLIAANRHHLSLISSPCIGGNNKNVVSVRFVSALCSSSRRSQGALLSVLSLSSVFLLPCRFDDFIIA